MAGTAVAGELNGRPDVPCAEFAVATRADEAELRALLRATPTPGAVSLCFEREPDYFTGEGVAGARDTTIIARRGGRVVCMGRCSRRVVYVSGERREAGYLGELRLAPNTPGGLAVLRAGYAFFARHEATRREGPAEFYFTSVAESNARARAVLESGRLGLPKYEAEAALITVVWPLRRRAVRTPRTASDAGGELTAFLETEAKRYALSSPWDAGNRALLRAHGLDDGGFCVVRRAGRIVAAGGVWDQSAWRQTVVAGYAGALRWARGLVNVAACVSGRPRLPSAGARLRQACVHPLAVAADATEAEVEELFRKLERSAADRAIEWLAVSVAPEDKLRLALGGRAGAREYATRLYAVRLPGLRGANLDLRGQMVRPEAGLL